MRSIDTSIDIDAPAETVWDVLTDFECYDEWNTVTRIEGQAVAGERLVVSPGPEAGRMPTFRPRVLRAAPGEELRWRGKLFVGGLFDGEHAVEIQRLGESSSRLVQSETFEGLLVGLVLRRYVNGPRRTSGPRTRRSSAARSRWPREPTRSPRPAGPPKHRGPPPGATGTRRPDAAARAARRPASADDGRAVAHSPTSLSGSRGTTTSFRRRNGGVQGAS